jgi:hypothetical protein
MTKQYDMDLVRVSPDAKFRSYDELVMAPIQAIDVEKKTLEGEDRETVVKMVKENFRKEMQYYFRSVRTDELSGMEGWKVARLELALTRLNKNEIAFEGRIIDRQTGRELCAFADLKNKWDRGPAYTGRSLEHGWRGYKFMDHDIYSDIWAEKVGDVIRDHR